MSEEATVDGREAPKAGEEVADAKVVPPAPSRRAAWRRWAFVLVPAWGLFELLAHVKQTRSAPTDAEWLAARDAVAAEAKADDLILFAPKWTDPLGREFFGDALVPIAKEARADETRFPRAIEVSIRGGHRDELAGWKRGDAKRVGPFTITTWENPSPATVIDDLLAHDGPSGMSVQRIDGGRESECPWTHGAPQTGALGSGPTVPGDRFTCPGGSFVGVSIIHDMDNAPRRCFFAPPAGGSTVLRVRFVNVAFGGALHGHVGLAQFAERDRTGAPVTIAWRLGDRVIGRIVHNDGEGWKYFELDTRDWAGKKGELVAEITAPNGNHRHYCFEADTR